MSKKHAEHQVTKQMDVDFGPPFESIVQKIVERDLPKTRWGYAFQGITESYYPVIWQQGNFTVAMLYGENTERVVTVGVARRSPSDVNTDTGVILALSRAIRNLIPFYR